MNVNCKLLVNNLEGDVEFVDMTLDFDHVIGSFEDPDDKNLINLIVYGQNYQVLRNEYIDAYIQFEADSI